MADQNSNKPRGGSLIRVAKWCLMVGVVVAAALFRVRTWRGVLPVAMLALTLGLLLFGRPGRAESAKPFRLDSPEQVIWFLVALLALGMVIFGI